MAEVRIAAEPRTEFGKGAARRIRRADKVPAVIYGHGAPPQHITLPGHELMIALRAPNVLLSVETSEGALLALPKDVQRDKVKGFLEHVDLVIVRRGEKVTVEVPVHTVGEIAPDGLLQQSLATLSIEAEATHIPAAIDVSVEGLVVGDAIHAQDLKLPEGSVLITEADALVVHVTAAPTAEQMEAELGEVEAATPEGEEPAAVPAAEEAPEEW